MLEPGTVWGAAATTLEYAVADFALSRLAKAVGNEDVAQSALARSRSWRHLFNPDTGHIEPRAADGAFPEEYDVAAGDGFVEGNSAQYTWFVPHDVGGLVELMGGRQAAAERLDEFLSRLNAGPKEPYAYLGNEPSLGAPWLYAWLGQPAAIQDILRRALPALFTDEPGGLPGNDDLGTMSAWYVLATLGLYPAIPGTDVLVVTTPQVPRAVLHLPKGDVKLKAPDVVGKPYVEELRIDGEWHGETWLRFKQIRKGATLSFTTAQRPTSWGTRPQDAPPSATG
jgi:predicted alpha-1,2-mannosidase